MRILVDTNILFSALVFPRSKPARGFALYRRESRNCPVRPQHCGAEKLIRDAKDQPILNAAIVSDVDIILTGDKDFLSLDMEHPKCMTVAQFLESEGVGE